MCVNTNRVYHHEYKIRLDLVVVIWYSLHVKTKGITMETLAYVFGYGVLLAMLIGGWYNA